MASRLTLALTQGGARSILKDVDTELKFIRIRTKDERERQMPEYAVLQDTAQSVLFDWLQDQHLRQVRKSITVKQMLDHLYNKFRVTTKIVLATACDEYQQLRFRQGNYMTGFIDLFEKKAD